MKINKVRLVNSNLSVAIDYTDESGQEHLLILGAENVVENWQAVEQPLALDSATPDIKGGVLVTSVDGVIKNARVIPPTSKANRWAEGAQMDYYNNTSPLEFISDVYDIMKDGDCLSPEKLNADVVDMLGKYLSAQQSVQAATNTCPYCGAQARER